MQHITGHPTKLPVMWEARVGHSGVPARTPERIEATSIHCVRLFSLLVPFRSKLGTQEPADMRI